MRWFTTLLLLLVARPLVAQNNVSAPGSPTASVSGVVYDSLAGKRLRGALVQLVGTDSLSRFGSTVTSDSLGRFTFGAVPDGAYNLGFYHPLLDSLGLEPSVHPVRVAAASSVRFDLSVPSAERLRSTICGPQTRNNSAALVMGVVRDTRDRSPISGTKVVASWLELTFAAGGVSRNMPRRITTTKENGWFALCNVPNPGALQLIASRGADSTDYIELQMPPAGFLRRDLYVGPTRLVRSDTSPARDSVQRNTKHLYAGDGRLNGNVVAVDGVAPVRDALVAIVNGPETHTNERGEWSLRDIAPGTRTLETRAVGHYPNRQAVDVVEGAPPVRVELTTLKAVLATIKVTAARSGERNLIAFEERRHSSGTGRFLNAADIAKRNPIVTSELFRALPGVYYEGRDTTLIQMRGVFEDRCTPAIFINGQQMQNISAGDIDVFVKPRDLVGVEIYSVGTAPGQFQAPLSGCGSIVFWTR